RERTGVYGPRSGPIHPPDPGSAARCGGFPIAAAPREGPYLAWLRSEEGHRPDRGAAFRERRRSPAVLPTSPLRTAVPHACSERPANAERGLKRAIAPHGRRRGIEG